MSTPETKIPEQRAETEKTTHDELIKTLKNETTGDLKELKNRVEENKKGIDNKIAIVEKVKKCEKKLKISQLLMLEEIVPETLLSLYIPEIDPMNGVQEGNEYIVDFQNNKGADALIGLGDILKSDFKEVWINRNDNQGWIKGVRSACKTDSGVDRIGYKDQNGEYLEIHGLDNKYKFKAFKEINSETKKLFDSKTTNKNESGGFFESIGTLNIFKKDTYLGKINSEKEIKNTYFNYISTQEDELDIEILLSQNNKEVLHGESISNQIENAKNSLNEDISPKKRKKIEKWIKRAETYLQNIPDIFKDISVDQLAKSPIDDLVRIAAKKYEFGPNEIEAIVRQMRHESAGFNIFAISGRGAFGIGQLMPEIAKAYQLDRENPLQNIDGALKLMREEKDRFMKSLPMAMLAYNTGSPNLNKEINKYGYPKKLNDFKSVDSWAQATDLHKQTKDYFHKIGIIT